jgi:HlyD family secretion protein
LAGVIAGELKLFELRRTARLGQKAQLEERILQLRDPDLIDIAPT